MARITEIYLDIGRQRKLLMVGHFLAPVPRQRLVEFFWQLARILDQRVDHCLRILASIIYRTKEFGGLIASRVTGNDIFAVNL
jgi:hypothetical protein